MNRLRTTLFLLVSVLCVTLGYAQPPPSGQVPANPPEKKESPPKPRPDVRDASYGPHERNVLDLWKAPSDKPTPLLVFFHGGGFMRGDKKALDPYLLDLCLKAGISVAAANYRYTTQAPFPAPMRDSARAIQFLRSKAREWNLDPKRFAAAGGSAGAGISLWIGFHDDLADSTSNDPVLRQSSRLSCMTVLQAQSSYDPRFIKEHIGGRAYEHPALTTFYGLKPEELDTPRAYNLFEEASPITYVNAGDPPVFMFYVDSNEPLDPGPNKGANLCYDDFGKPIDGYPKPGAGIHHPKFGALLKEKLDPLHIECVIRNARDYPGTGNRVEPADRDIVEFLKRQFQMNGR